MKYILLLIRFILGVKFYRDSIPKSCTTEEKMNKYLDLLVGSSSPMRSMKMIVLGNGRIGKTTFVKYLSNVLLHSSVVSKITKKREVPNNMLIFVKLGDLLY